MAEPRRYALGMGVTLSASISSAGAPADPAALELRLREPDGTEVVHTYPPAGVIVRDALGEFHANIEPDAEGLWLWRYVSETPSAAFEGRFEVYSAFAPAVVGEHRSYTYNLSNGVGLVRFHTDDRDLSAVDETLPLEQRSAAWSDEEIQAILDSEGVNGNVLLASARLLVILANNRQLLVQSRRIGKTDVDYGNARRDLLAQAQALRDEARSDEGGAFAPADGIAEVVHDDFSLREIVTNASLRDY